MIDILLPEPALNADNAAMQRRILVAHLLLAERACHLKHRNNQEENYLFPMPLKEFRYGPYSILGEVIAGDAVDFQAFLQCLGKLSAS